MVSDAVKPVRAFSCSNCLIYCSGKLIVLFMVYPPRKKVIWAAVKSKQKIRGEFVFLRALRKVGRAREWVLMYSVRTPGVETSQQKYIRALELAGGRKQRSGAASDTCSGLGPLPLTY